MSLPTENKIVDVEHLPFHHGDLEGFLSKDQLKVIYDEQLQGMVKRLNDVLKVTPMGKLHKVPVEEIIMNSDGIVYHLSSMIFNTMFFLKSIRPIKQDKGSQPSGIMMDLIKRSFEDVNTLREHFVAMSNTVRAGWCWLVLDPVTGCLRVIALHGAGNPIRAVDTTMGVMRGSVLSMDPTMTLDPTLTHIRRAADTTDLSFVRENLGIPLVCINLYEHAYMLDYKIDRAAYVKKFFECINWEVVNDRIQCVRQVIKEGHKVMTADTCL